MEIKYSTFQDYLRADTAIHWCLHNLLIIDEKMLHDALLDESAMAISDGSYKDTFGTASWTIGDPNIDGLISGVAVCPGNADDMDSYRCELVGIYCIMVIVQKFCEYYHISKGSIELGCDGLSALESIFDKGDYLFHDIPSFDLISAILSLQRKSPLQWLHRHVRGHQDRDNRDLDVWANRNILMDTRAKQHLSTARNYPRHFSVQGEPWQVWLGSKKLTSRLQSQIYSHVHDHDGSTYWSDKPSCSPEVVDLVDWKAIGQSMMGTKRSRRVFVTKHVAGMCGVSKFMYRWKQWDKDQCPRCGEPEDAPHVWTCKDSGARDLWDKAMASIELTLRRLDTEPTIRHLILLYLKGWQTNEDITYLPPRALEAAVQEQI